MLKRKLYKQLMDWKEHNSRSKALFLEGARQVGKSTLARTFGKDNYEKVIEINFLNDPGAAKIFKAGNAQEILEQLGVYMKEELIPHRTLIILDEIQECPAARTAVKFLVQDGRFDYIETGSLLGIEYLPVRSYPVGFEQKLSMYPLDLEEFLWALDFPESGMEHLKKCWDTKTPVGEAAHERMLKLFDLWLVIGGMPEAVQMYVETHDIMRAVAVQNMILDLYRKDIARYSKGIMNLKIHAIFDAIPSQLDDKNRRFRLNSVPGHRQYRDLESSFLWLEEAGVALPCFNTAQPVAPLRLNEKRNLFKLYMSDTGLLCAASSGPVQSAILEGDRSINKGGILENAFAQALTSKNFDLFYYDSKKIGELDFLVQNGNAVDLLEIKSGKDFKKHTAMDKALSVRDWSFDQKIVFCPADLCQQDGIVYAPFYMILFYGEKEEQKLLWDPVLPEFS